MNKTYLIIGIVVIVLLILSGVVLFLLLRRSSKKNDVNVTIFPTQASLIVGTERTFTAQVTEKTNKDIDKNVTWTTNNSSLGSIKSNGEFTANNSPGTVTITATSVEDKSKSASATVTILPEVLREAAHYRMLIFGIIMIVIMIYKPQGFIKPKRPVFNIDKL